MRLHNKPVVKELRKLEKLKKKIKKTRHHATTQGGILDVKKYGCQLLDGLSALIRYLKTIRDVVGERTLLFLTDLFVTLYNMYKADDWTGLILNITSFFTRYFPMHYADYAIEWFKSAFNIVCAQSTGNKYHDFITSIFNYTNDFLDDTLWKNIQTFFVKIVALYGALTDAVSFEALDLETIVEKFFVFRSQLPEAKDLIDMVFSAYSFVLGNWDHIKTGDWSCVMLGKDETQEFEMEVRVLEQAFTLVISQKFIELQDKYHMTRDIFVTRLEKAIRHAKTLISRCSSTQQKMCVSNFIRSLTDKQAQIYAAFADAPRKLEAYAVKFSGPSGCGKSTLIDLVSKVMLRAYKHDPHARGQVVFTNVSEKFESTPMPNHKIICADDVANNSNENPNYDRILNYVNTVPRPLEKADSKEKGIYYPGNDGFLCTTNDETIRAMHCSSCPESILRRFALDVKVEIREKYRTKFGGLKKLEKPQFDVYNLTLRRFSHIEDCVSNDNDDEDVEPLIEYSKPCKGKRVVWKIIPRDIWNPSDDGKHDFHAMIAFISKDVQRHIDDQKSRAQAQKELDECEFCEECGCPKMICICNMKPKLNEVAEKIVSSDNSIFPDGSLFIDDPIVVETVNDDDDISIPSLVYPQDIEDDISVSSDDDIPPMIPRSVESDLYNLEGRPEIQSGTIWQTFGTAELWDIRSLLSGSLSAGERMYRKGAIYTKIYRHRSTLWTIAMRTIGAIILGALISPKVALPIVASQLMYSIYMYSIIVKQVDDEIARRKDRLSCLCISVHEHFNNNMKKYFAIGASILVMHQAYTALKPFIFTQDKSTYFDEKVDIFKRMINSPDSNGLHRVRVEDERDYKEGYSRIPPRQTPVSKTTSSKDLQETLMRKLRFVVVKSAGEVHCTVNGIMVEGNVIMIPSHAIPDVFPFDIETSTAPGIPSAKTKDQKLIEKNVVIDREHDVAFVHLASSPRSDPLVDFFPMEYPTFRTRATTLLWKSPSNEIFRSEQPARQLPTSMPYYGYLEKPGRIYGTRQTLVKYVLSPGEGLKVDLEFNGFGGLCGGLYVDSSKGIIYGFHVAGVPETKTGYMTCITQPMIRDAIAELKSKSSTLVTHSEGILRVDLYDQPYTLDDNTPLYMREDGTQDKSIVTFRGRVLKEGMPLESRARPPYIPTPFKGVQENLGERKHMPPKKPNDVAKGMNTLNKLTNPVQHYEMDVLDRAIEDYKEQTLKVVRENKEELKDVFRIYSQEEAMDGIGEFGLCGIPNSTSAGFPINKTKKDCLVRDPMDEANVKVPREFNDKFDVQGEIDRTWKCWADGISSEPIYKASSKVNELLPDKKAKAKVRKFYGSGFANFIASRRALAGIPRFMRKYWKVTECLVGINPTSKEWDEFHEYLTEFGTENMIAGDFAGFDTRMAAQITGAAAQIMISWYEAVGCTEEELQFVRGALSDIIHPNILFDGDLYTFANGNPSGNLITVQLNSICNSLMMRYVYYSMMRNVKENFSQNVKLGTYGDDNAMSVKPRCKWFTHTSCQKEFAKLDIEYTMAHKDQDSVPYITIEDISFLKRNFRKHESIPKMVAPIEFDSVYKKFHWIKKPNESPLSPEEQFGAYTDGSFREMYLHGRQVYEDFSQKIQNIVDLNPSLKTQVSFIPYDEMTQILLPYYHEDYVNDNRKLFAESCGIEEEDDVAQVALVNAEPVKVDKKKKDKFDPEKLYWVLFRVCVKTSVVMLIVDAIDRYFEKSKIIVDTPFGPMLDRSGPSKYDDFKVRLQKRLEVLYDEPYTLNGAKGVLTELGVPQFLHSYLISLCEKVRKDYVVK